MEPSLLDALSPSTGPGAVFGVETEDLDMTLVTWPDGYTIPAHVNAEVDVVMIVLAGTGEAAVGSERFPLQAGSIVVIRKGSERSVQSHSPDFRYLNVHKRRKRLMPTGMARPGRNA